MTMPLQALLMAVGLLFAGLVHATGPLEACGAEHLNLLPDVQIFEDPHAVLSFEEVVQLPLARFTAATNDWPAQGYTHSAFWLRLQLKNSDNVDCSRVLVIGAPRLEDIQVYQTKGGDWSLSRAGSAYPRTEWPDTARQPAFPVSLPAGETVTLMVRVFSNSQMMVGPELWSERLLLKSQQLAFLSDGLTIGIVLLIVPFSLAVGWIMRSRLLAVHAGAVLSYILLTCVVNGYLVFWPAALGWSREILALASVVAYGFFLAYIRVLLQVSSLPRIFPWLYSLLLLGLASGRLWGVTVDSVQGAMVAEIFTKGFYPVLVVTLFLGWRRGFAYNWMAWLVPGLLISQFVIRHVLQLEQLERVIWQSQQDRYSLSSTLAGVALLVCTLIMAISHSRMREKSALASLDQQRQAEHERLESKVVLRTSQLRDSLAARSKLMARISHDLRSPLITIIDYARRLREKPNLQDPVSIERNARQQLELIDELLEFSRGEVEEMELALAAGYLYGFLREIEEEAGFIASRQGNTFEVVLSDDLPALVQADFKRLRQILMNLLTNAAKFTSDGHIRLEIDSRPGEAPATVELLFCVTDTGIGIDPAEHEQLLQPFRRGRNAQLYDGSGLGLSIVSQLLQRMGSQLESETMDQGGSRFSFRLQLVRAGEQDMESVLADNNIAPIDGVGRHILVVDDIEQNREWLYDLLAGYGFDVSLAANGENALVCLGKQEVDLVISDQMMPGLDGWVLLRKIRDRWPDLAVMLYSAAPARQPDDHPAELAFDAVLLKPSDSSELLANIETLTRRVVAKERSIC